MCILCRGNLDYSITELLCCSKVTDIPKEFTQLTWLDFYGTKITKIPKEFTKLTELNCRDCPLVKIPLQFKERHVKEYNFLRVPTKSRMIFNQYKRSYLEPIRLQLEINWAPSGQGALKLFEKYRN